jgi:hypothetical protein
MHTGGLATREARVADAATIPAVAPTIPEQRLICQYLLKCSAQVYARADLKPEQ